MVRSHHAAVAVAALASLALVPMAHAVANLDFEDLPDQGIWSAGDSFVTGGITVNVSDSNGYSGGSTQTESPNAAGPGKGLFVEQVLLTFQFDYPFTDAWFNYATFGGDVGVLINGELWSNSDPLGFDGDTLAGVLFTVVEDVPGFSGTIHLHGNITEFGIAVEDGEIDNVGCAPTPGAGSALALAGILGVRRRRR